MSQFRAAVDQFLCRVTRQCKTKLHSHEQPQPDLRSICVRGAEANVQLSET